MPSWSEIINQTRKAEDPLSVMQKEYLRLMHEYTNRNVIAYYSGFIQKPTIRGISIEEDDKNAFMQAIYGLNRELGLDLILHTPGGGIAATESIVFYLKKMFNNDIRVIVPQIAMSAGTMIALSAKEIVMGKHSNLGPIDPQFGGVSCAGVIEEFERATKEVIENPNAAALWRPIIGQYHPTFIGDCQKAIKWADSIVKEWLIDNMFSDMADKQKRAGKVVKALSSHSKTYSHGRHIHFDELKKLGIKVTALEGLDNSKKKDCKDLQDCVLSLHHIFMEMLSNSECIKIVGNHNGESMYVRAREG